MALVVCAYAGYLYVLACCCVLEEVANIFAVVLGSPLTSDASSARKFGATKSPPSAEQDRQLVSCPINWYYGYEHFTAWF